MTNPRRRRRKRYRKNPPAILAKAQSTAMTAAMGAAAIAVNKILANQITNIANLGSQNKKFVEIGTAIIALPFLGKLLKVPGAARAAETAAAVAIFDGLKDFLPANVQKLFEPSLPVTRIGQDPYYRGFLPPATKAIAPVPVFKLNEMN